MSVNASRSERQGARSTASRWLWPYLLLGCGAACGRTSSSPSPPVWGGESGGPAETDAIRGGAGAVTNGGGTPACPVPGPEAAADSEAEIWSDAAKRRADALCACVGDSASQPEACTNALSAVPNAACISALLPSAPRRWQCLADVLLQEAACYANAACANGHAPDCAAMQDCPAPAFAEIEAFCGSRTCDGGSRVISHEICDGSCDCRDGSDERNCSPGLQAFECDDGELLAPEQVCDGAPGCVDASDELHCR